MEVSNDILLYLIIVLSFFVLILFVLVGVLFSRFKAQKRRYDTFMGTNKRPEYSLENKIDSYFKSVKEIESHYKKLLFLVEDIDSGYKKNIQKVGLIKYNPFAEMGGNLCFALAILDGEDNGVVINGIHSRTGSFTYAKPIEHGVSIYLLSEEEIEAIEKAKETAHQPKFKRSAKVKFTPEFKKKVAKHKQDGNAKQNHKVENVQKSAENINTVNKEIKDYENNEKINEGRSNSNSSSNISSSNNTYDRRNKIKSVKIKPKTTHDGGVGGKRYSVGDVTEEEKSRILEDEKEAVKIAKAYEPKNSMKQRIMKEAGIGIVDNSDNIPVVNKSDKPKRTTRFSEDNQD